MQHYKGTILLIPSDQLNFDCLFKINIAYVKKN